MSTAIDSRTSNAVRVWLGVFGLVAVIAGIAILAWPAKTLAIAGGTITLLLAIYALVAGLVYIGTGIFTRGVAFWSRIWRLLLGVLLVVSGIIVITGLATATQWMILFVTIMVGLSWITEGVLAFIHLGQSQSKGITFFFAAISIIAGIAILFWPLYGVGALWWVAGVMAIIYGLMQIIAAFRA